MSIKKLAALDDSELEKVAGGVGAGGIVSSGSFTSSTGTKLNIIVNWAGVADGAGQVSLEVVVSATSATLDCQSLPNGVELTVAGMTYISSNNAISYHGSGMVTNVLASFVIRNVYGTVPITAVWHFNGTYSGVPIGGIYASGVANL